MTHQQLSVAGLVLTPLAVGRPVIWFHRKMKKHRLNRAFWALVSYWLLFIIAPTVAVFFALGISIKTGAVCVGTFFLLVLIGEHGLRYWERLFRDE